MSNIRELYTMTEAQMPEWKSICEAFAKKIDAKLLFVNEQSCGVGYKDGSFQHIYVDEMYDYLNRQSKEMQSFGKNDVKMNKAVTKDMVKE